MRVLLKSLDDTLYLGKQLATFSEKGMVIIFTGEIASGKTTLIRSIVNTLGYIKPVTSPTYTLTNVYGCHDFNVVHSDFYRITSLHEVYGLGLDLYLDDSLNLVEWGEKFIDFFDEYLLLKLDFGEINQDHRIVTFDPSKLSDRLYQKFQFFFKENYN